jgi:ribosomal-protein-serine acetyltransferase
VRLAPPLPNTGRGGEARTIRRRGSRRVPHNDWVAAIMRASLLDSMESMIELAAQRLAIRPWLASDAPALNVAITESIEHLRPWMSWIATEPLSLAERQSVIARWERKRRAGGDMVFGMFIGAVVVGGCGLHRRLGPDGLEIGYWVHAAHVRRGHAASVAAMLTSVAFSYPEIELVEIHCDRANHPSQGVPRRLGFTLVGQRTKPVQAPNETGLQDVWRVTRSDWVRDG